jgi:hypothetical protein
MRLRLGRRMDENGYLARSSAYLACNMTGHTSTRVIAGGMGSAELAGLGERLHMSHSDSGRQVSARVRRNSSDSGTGGTSALLELDSSAVSGARRMSVFSPTSLHLAHARSACSMRLIERYWASLRGSYA